MAGFLLLGFLVVPAALRGDESADPAATDPQARGFRRSSRLEFDERLIMGQSLRSGAIYLFERKDSEIQSMLKVRKDYRDELLAPLQPPP